MDETTPTNEVEKNRLFETLDKEDAGGKNYWKFLVPIVMVVAVCIAAVIYGTRRQVGDQVRPEQDLYDAVNDNMLTKQKRQPLDMVFYYCGSFYAAEIAVEARPVRTGNWENDATLYKAVVRQLDDGSWQVNAFPIREKQVASACEQASFGPGQ